MDLLKRLTRFLNSAVPTAAPTLYPLSVRCSRCGEIIQTQVNLNNDLSVDYRDRGGSVYHCRKVLMGQQRCFQTVEVQLTFDANRRLLEREISGGQFVDG